MRQLKKISTFEEAYQKALQKLGRSDCSCQAMYTYLSNRGCPEEIAQAVIKKLLELRYIDDKKLCHHLGERWQSEGLYGRKMFQAKLARQGFAKELVHEVLENVEVDEKAKANKLFLSSLKRIKKYDDKTVDKIIRYLASKGFSYPLIKSVMEDNKDVLISSQGQSCLDTYFKNLYN